MKFKIYNDFRWSNDWLFVIQSSIHEPIQRLYFFKNRQLYQYMIYHVTQTTSLANPPLHKITTGTPITLPRYMESWPDTDLNPTLYSIYLLHFNICQLPNCCKKCCCIIILAGEVSCHRCDRCHLHRYFHAISDSIWLSFSN